MFRHNICNRIDSVVEAVNGFILGDTKCCEYIEELFIRQEIIKCVDDRIVINVPGNKLLGIEDVFAFYRPEDDVEWVRQVVYDFIKTAKNGKTYENQTRDRVVLGGFLKYCIGLYAGYDYKMQVLRCEEINAENKKAVTERENYKSILNSINQSIGKIWSEDIY